MKSCTVKRNSAKVITTCFQGRVIREENGLCGNPIGYYNHCQNFPTSESVIELLDLIVARELVVDPGAYCDTIIINNDIGYEPGNTMLRSINGLKTPGGEIKVFTRGNYGRSFGGYNFAFRNFMSVYDYWIFTEDDILVDGNKYVDKLINKFHSKVNIGFVALQNVSNQGLDGTINDKWLHAHGGVGLSSRQVLFNLYYKLGRLPHCSSDESQDYENIIVNGEIMFTHRIVSDLGLELAVADEKLYTYAYDYIKQNKQ